MTADPWGSAPAIEGDVWGALSQSSGPEIFKFTSVGDSITGMITEPPVIEPAREYGSNEPRTDYRGDPVMQVVLVVKSDALQSDSDDGVRRVYLDKPLMKQRVKTALERAGEKSLKVGGTVTITFTAKVQSRGGGLMHDFDATYEPPAPY